jgi:hypothetical protein
LESHSQQVTLSCDLVKNEGHQMLASNAIGHAFGIEASHVRKRCSNADKKPKPPYRPPALNEGQIAGVLSSEVDIPLIIT